MVGTNEGTVPATSHEDKSHPVNWSFLLQNLVAGTNFAVPVTCPTNLDQFEFLGQVPATCSSKCFMSIM